jgi:hypothetical protein
MTRKDDGHVNARGNTKDRAARRHWLLSPQAGWHGDGTEAPCWECGEMVDWHTMVIDRIVPGKDGGRYVHGNIRPQCFSCSYHQGYILGMGAARLAA